MVPEVSTYGGTVVAHVAVDRGSLLFRGRRLRLPRENGHRDHLWHSAAERSGRRPSMFSADDTLEARVALACQGGGSHAAYTAGVLKAILRHQATRPYRIMGFSGTSGGAICALLAWYGQLQGGPTPPAAPAQRGERLGPSRQETAHSHPW